jgi:predicted NUDIX family NTP pyrophosphohydrolase
MRQSAGILLYRNPSSALEIFLVHPGGPFWKDKDLGAWSIPKGEFAEGEEPLAAAIREFKEETGYRVAGAFHELLPVKQKSGKLVLAWALEGSIDEQKLMSNKFSLEWPSRSGKFMQFPEVDKGEWFAADLARQKINAAQADFISQLLHRLRQ